MTREDLVQEFRKAVDHGVGLSEIEKLTLDKALIEEEYKELMVEIDFLINKLRYDVAPTKQDLAKLLKEMADLQYVVSGLAVENGLPLDKAFVRVHESNMTKVEGGIVRNSAGKVLKGSGYRPCYLEDLICG